MAEAGDIKLDCANLNTTECILRAATQILAEVKKNGDEFNWDPPTFAVTLIIGFIAIFFAALTIGQGLIAAAPGKHCSKYALGPWAHYSKRRFDISEMRVQATAYTPILRTDELLKYLYFNKLNDAQDCTDIKEETKEEWKREIFPSSKGINQYFPATWLALLTHIGLDHPGIWTLKPTRTDYIPSDLVAAPAYASIQHMVVFAALVAVPNKLQLSYQGSPPDLISIYGAGFDLDLRKHPSIGTHGVFQIFTTLHDASKRRDFEQRFGVSYSMLISRIMWFTYGYIPQREGVNYSPMALQSMMTQMSGDAQRNALGISTREVIWEKIRWSSLINLSACRGLRSRSSNKCCDTSVFCQCWGRHGLLKDILGDLNPRTFNVFRLPWQLLMAETPRFRPALFPRRFTKLATRVQSYLILSRFWSLNPGSIYEPCSPARQSSTSSRGSKVDTGFPSFDMQPDLVKYCRHYLEAIDSDDLEIFHTKCNADPQGSVQLDREIRKLDRYLDTEVPLSLLVCRFYSIGCAALFCNILTRLKWKLASEDKEAQLWSKGEASADGGFKTPLNFCSQRSRGRVTRTCDILKVVIPWYREDPWDDTSGQGRYLPGFRHPRVFGERKHVALVDELEKVLKIWELTEDGVFKYPRAEVQHYLDDLLIYRAIMIAIKLTEAVDNSDILENEAYSKIIPFL